MVEIPATVERESDEQLGTKPKFWFRHIDGDRWLFKFARPNTGEHWSEKVACEIARLLHLPHAHIELATFEGKWGSISRDFTLEGRHALVHGNELLTELDASYATGDTYRVSGHTVEAIFGVLSQDFIQAPTSGELAAWITPFDLFTGYLLLDALIGNTDRHHENWGILLTNSQPRRAELAPTFDHASSLGREFTDESRQKRYEPRTSRFRVEDYVRKARSALFASAEAKRPMSPLEAFRRAAKLAPPASQYWLDKLRGCAHELAAMAEMIPNEAANQPARAFCAQVLGFASQRLLE